MRRKTPNKSGRRQLALPGTGDWGGKRRGAGRKPGPRPIVLHRARPRHQSRFPVHATLRALPAAGSLRDCPGWNAVEAALAAASRRDFRICHFSVQHDHLHLIVEAVDGDALVSGLRGLSVRVARRLNAALGRRGRVWADRYHVHTLRTPREVRAALVYVLHNWKKTVPGAERLDSCSSARWFDGWRPPVPAWAQPPADERPPVRAPRTWLLTTGWRRHGLVGLDAQPLPYPAAR